MPSISSRLSCVSDAIGVRHERADGATSRPRSPKDRQAAPELIVMPSEPVSESCVLRRDQLVALIAAAVVLVAVALVIGSLVNGPSAVRRAPESSVSELTTTAATATTTTTMPAATAVGTLPATTARATVIPTISPVQRQLVTTTTADFHLANSGGVTDDSFMGAFEIFFRRYGLDER